jgi:hypothetical protein
MAHATRGLSHIVFYLGDPLVASTSIAQPMGIALADRLAAYDLLVNRDTIHRASSITRRSTSSSQRMIYTTVKVASVTGGRSYPLLTDHPSRRGEQNVVADDLVSHHFGRR